MTALPHLPILRGGRPYRSLAVVTLPDVRNGAPVVEVSQANPGLIARDLAGAAAARAELEQFTTAELVAACGRAAELFVHGTLPLGEGTQSPDEYLAQLASTTGLPVALAKRNREKIRSALASMATILAGLTRGLDLAVLDRGWGTTATGGLVAFRRSADVLGAVLPSNSPGVHSLWLPAVALKTALALRAGRQEPWTPYRVIQAFLAAGLPPNAFGFYPSDHAGASEILQRAGRSLLFGDAGTVAPWREDPRVEIHGPGWSKVVFGEDRAGDWAQYLDLLATSVAANGGRSCINASGVWTPHHGEAIARGLAERLAQIPARALDDPEAQLAAFASKAAAERVSDYIDARLAIPGARDVTAEFRTGPRVAEIDGCAFLLPTVVFCDDPSHPLAQTELLFPFVAVVEMAEVPCEKLVAAMGSSLVVTALTDDPALQAELMNAAEIDRLNLAPVPTGQVAWDQPHEGNLFDLLFRQRAITPPVVPDASDAPAVVEVAG